MENSKVDMLSGPLLKNIIIFAIPVMLGGWLQMMFNAADVIVIGQFCGSTSVGAMGATAAISALIINLFMGLSVGASVSVAHAVGSGDNEKVYKTVHTAILTAVLGGLCIAAIGVPLAKPMLRLMDTPESVIDLSASYMRIILGGSVFSMVYNFGAAILRAVGDSKRPLYFIAIGGAANVVLNLFFVLVLKLDVLGVALATVISNALSAFLVIYVLIHRTDVCRLVFKELRIYKDAFLSIVRIGFPSGVQASLFSIANVIIQSSVNSFGEALMSAHTAGSNINSLTNVAVAGFSTATINFVGQNIGAKQYKRVRKVIFTCLRLTCVVGTLLGVTVFIFGRPLLGLYITDSEEAIAWGLIRMKCVGLPYVLFAAYDVFSSALRGMGKSTLGMIISLCGTCAVRILWILTVFSIPRFHTPVVLFLSYPLSWSLSFIAMMTATLLCLRKYPNTDGGEEASA